jgi:twitching motility two-component system response regulator PilH
VKKILVCDDSSFFRTVYQEYLCKGGFDVTVVPDGKGTLAKVREVAPDLILLDVILPDTDGYEVCKKLKADPATQHIPVVMCTVKGSAPEQDQGLRAGADAYFSKSGSPENLLARINELIGNEKV